MGRQGGDGGWAVLLVIVMSAAILVAVVFWLIAILTIAGSILWWLKDIWHDDQPGEIGYHLKRWLAPRWHYPFVGVGSVIASVAGADAMHEIVKGANPAPPILVLIIVLVRSVSMAWFPWPRTIPAGLHVYPWIAVTGPLASALGMAAVWVLVIGGQITGPPHSHQYWLSLSCASFAILIILMATAVGRAGRILVPRSAPNRTDMGTVLDLASSSEEMDLPRTPPPPRSHCTRLIPPIGPAEGHWAAVRPSLLLNWKRLLWVPIGAVVGAGAGCLMVVVYSAGSPLPTKDHSVCEGPPPLVRKYSESSMMRTRAIVPSSKSSLPLSISAVIWGMSSPSATHRSEHSLATRTNLLTNSRPAAVRAGPLRERATDPSLSTRHR
ncbi:MAG: hypothetical protein ACYCYK_12580 [Candidatus Dormibacteria bacterium]